jgi:uncharacterized protein YciI
MIRLSAVPLLAAALLAQPAAPDSTELYYLVFLRPSPDRKIMPRAEGERIQADHLANMRALGARGVLLAAGQFEDDPPSISGIFVLKAASLEDARRIAGQDPTVAAHRNTAEVYAWRGPAGVGEEYIKLHRERPDTPDDMGIQPFCLLFHGPAWSQHAADRAQTLAAHADYIASLRRDGKLGAAGPIEGGGDLLALVILARMTDDAALQLINNDPAVKSGIFRVDYHRWWSAEHVLPK